MPGERGYIHMISLAALFLALIGVLHLYKGYREKHFRESLMEALDEGKRLADTFVTDPGQKSAVSRVYQQARQVIEQSPGIADDAPLIGRVIASMRELAEQSRRGREER